VFFFFVVNCVTSILSASEWGLSALSACLGQVGFSGLNNFSPESAKTHALVFGRYRQAGKATFCPLCQHDKARWLRAFFSGLDIKHFQRKRGGRQRCNI
jgi:hypothetical protein